MARFTQGELERVGRRNGGEEMAVGTEAVSRDVGVAAVILGASDGVTVAKAVQLFGVDRIDMCTELEHWCDQGMVGVFDANGYRFRPGCLAQPGDEFGEAIGAVVDLELAEELAVGGEKADRVHARSPINPDEETEFQRTVGLRHQHTSTVFVRPTVVRHLSYTGARGA